MTELVAGALATAARYDAFIVDQWGVLHQGVRGYPGAAQTLAGLHGQGKRVALLSNSGKRAAFNAERLAKLGFAPETYDVLLTSGEAVWRAVDAGAQQWASAGGLWVVSQDERTSQEWRRGLAPELFADFEAAATALLLALPESGDPAAFEGRLASMRARGMLMVCGNPDVHAPGAKGNHPTPGFVAEMYEELGGEVVYYGKPHPEVFKQIQDGWPGLPAGRILVVGDNMETDIAGAQAMGFDSLLVCAGLHQSEFAGVDDAELPAAVERLADRLGLPAPTCCTRTLAS